MTSILSRHKKISGQPVGWIMLWCLGCGPAWGFGLGDLRVNSVAGEPLRAEIRLIAARPGDVGGTRARLANRDAFERAGLARSPQLETLRFRAVQRGDGSAVIEVTSAAPLSATTLHFLLEVHWSRGRLQREYLLTLGSPIADGPQEIPQIPVSKPQPAPVGPITVDTAPPLKPIMVTTALPPVADDKPATYTTAQDDTLGDIARNTMPPADINIQQMMLAMLRLNPEAFIGNNINALREGAVLRVPDLTEITRISQSQAVAEAAQQYAEWQESRDGTGEPELETAPKMAVASPPPEPLPPETAVASSPSEPPQPAAQAQRPSEGRLELVASEQNENREAPTSGSVSGGAIDAALRTELVLLRERAQTQDKQIQELEAQLRRTQKHMQQNDRFMTLQAEQLTLLQQQLAAPKKEAAIAPQPESRQMQLADVTAELLSGKWQWLVTAVLLLLCLYLVVLIWRTARPLPAKVSPVEGINGVRLD
ncbi:MAG: type IV pilus assembly protein FimV [Gammaproteobacteria bacterium]